MAAPTEPPLPDTDCVPFLQWALPRMAFTWPGFRKVRRQVRRRLRRRLDELGLAGLEAYRRHLAEHPEEWQHLADLCRITISRFYRDRHLFDHLAAELLPRLTREAESSDRPLRLWSAGCASGEEPYTLALIHHLAPFPTLRRVALELVATDADPHLLARARRACYPESALRELPAAWRRQAFRAGGSGELCLEARYRAGVTFLRQDLRSQAPGGAFDLILCRNLAFTYFARELQLEVLERLHRRLRPGGFLAVGSHEELPAGARGFTPWPDERCLYRLAV